MNTHCPHCHSVFLITEEELHQADGLVLCGVCENSFNALDHLDKDDEAPVDLPVLNAARDEDEDNDIRITPDESEPQHTNNSKPQSVPRALQDDLSTPAPTQPTAHGQNVALGVLILGLMAALLSQITLREWPNWVENPSMRPALKAACEVIGCDVPVWRDVQAIELLSRNVYTHPNVEGALMITASIVNNAALPQPFPTLGMQMTDLQGKVVASRYFKPSEYLGHDAPHIKMLPETPMNLALEIMDPDKRALAFEFLFY